MKKSFRTEILGQKLSLTSDQTEEFLKLLAGYVEETAGQVRTRFTAVDSLRIAIMTAVTIAEEYFIYRNHQEKVFSSLEKKVGELQEKIGSALNETLPGA